MQNLSKRGEANIFIATPTSTWRAFKHDYGGGGIPCVEHYLTRKPGGRTSLLQAEI